MTRLFLALALSLAAGDAGAACRDIAFDGASFTVCSANPATEDIRLWLRGTDGAILGTFDRVNDMLAAEGKRLAVAMNGGMYHDDRRPVGHYIENGTEEMRLVTNAGPGNFGMLPNGVLCLGDGTAAVVETLAYDRARPDCRYASQSGPMLVIEGALHPRFLPDSTSSNIRNGVGVAGDGTLWMAISNEAVTFHHFARLFRDALGTPNALYLDGSVSRLYAPALGRHDIGFPMGPILGTVVPAD